MLKMRHILSHWDKTRRKDLTLPGKSLWFYERVDMRAEKKMNMNSLIGQKLPEGQSTERKEHVQ